MAIANNTIRLRAEFKTFDDTYGDPTGLTFTVYDAFGVEITSSVTLTSANKIDTGIYEYDYLVPRGHRVIRCEFSGILEATRITGVETITVK